jgi:hypothetical protein
MAKLTQGTQVYFLDPETEMSMAVECATNFNPGGNPADQIEVTCLEDFVRMYKPGLRTPGTATLTINADPENDSHIRLHELGEENPPPTVWWAVGWSDGTAPPEVTVDSSGDPIFDLPDDRTWLVFMGYVSDFPFDFQLNTVVTTSVSIQRSGGLAWIRKVVSS